MDKIKAVLTSIITWLTITQAALVIAADEIGKAFADGSAATVISVIVRAIAIVGSVISLIRRLTPVLPSQRGLTLSAGVSPTLVIKSD